MKVSSRFIGLCTAACLSFSATAFELTHSNGPIQLPSAPETIATFDLSVLDSLNTLGIPVAGVPQSMYEGDLAKFANTTVIGTLFEPNYEVLESLKPELIFAGGRSGNAIPQLQKIAPVASFASSPEHFMTDFRQNNLALATAFDKQTEAQASIHAIDADLEQLQQNNAGKTGAFLFVANDNIIAHAPGDRFGYAYDLTGLESVVPVKDPNATPAPRPEPGSPEAKAAATARAEVINTIAQAEPDWLIVLDRSAINGAEKTAANTLAQHPVINQTEAFKAGRVYYADPNGWYVIGGGLTNLKNITTDLLQTMN